MSFFHELRRRNVLKVALAYLMLGWLLLELAARLFRWLDSPDGMVTLVASALALLFPFVLVIAWKFEMTPSGMKRTEALAPNESIPYWSRRKYGALIAGAALLAAGLRAWQFLRG